MTVTNSTIIDRGNGAPAESRQDHRNGTASGRRGRVFVIEDCPIVGRATASLIERETDLELCGVATGCAAALRRVEVLRPDLIVLGSGLQGREGLDQLKEIKTAFPQQPVLMFSISDEAPFAARAIREGAAGFVMKRESTDVLLTAVRRVLSGKRFVSDDLEEPAHGNVTIRQSGPVPDPFKTLTPRELEVLRLTGQGKSRAQIARLLGTSAKAVDYHRGQIKEKLCLKSANDMVRQAIEMEHDTLDSD